MFNSQRHKLKCDLDDDLLQKKLEGSLFASRSSAFAKNTEDINASNGDKKKGQNVIRIKLSTYN